MVDSAATSNLIHGEDGKSFYCWVDHEYIVADHNYKNGEFVSSTNLKGRIPRALPAGQTKFDSIEFSWKKGEHTKRGSFNPDFFLKQGKRIFVVEVKDDGPGVGDVAREGFREGLGLTNTRARLLQLYGPSHRLEMADGNEGGVVVTLEIPFEVEPGGNINGSL